MSHDRVPNDEISKSERSDGIVDPKDGDNSVLQKSLNVTEYLARFSPLIFLIMVGAILGSPETLKALSDIAVARGLITLFFSIGTIWVAILLATSSLNNASEAQFNRAKEILTVLVGIFGAILGYYFGSHEVADNRESPVGEVSSGEGNGEK